MLDEWCERQVDRLCAFVPAYLGPRMTRLCCTRVGWRLYLYAAALARRVGGAFSRIQWIEKETPAQVSPPARDGEAPAPQGIDPGLKKELDDWNAEQQVWQEKTRLEKLRRRTPQQRVRDWWAGRHERRRRSDARWAQREAAADERAQRRLARMLPAVAAMRRSRFGLALLMLSTSALGVLAAGGGEMAYLAASYGVMWLSVAFEVGYEPVCGGVRQRHLCATLLRALAFLLLLPMYFGAYVRQGVSSNVVLQSAMLMLLTAHAALFLALVAFNRRQPLLLRVLSGVLGVAPALSAASAVALAATVLARPLPLALAGALGAAGALMAFLADRLIAVTELGGIRLRYTPIWTGVLMTAGQLLMLLGGFMAVLPAAAL